MPTAVTNRIPLVGRLLPHHAGRLGPPGLRVRGRRRIPRARVSGKLPDSWRDEIGAAVDETTRVIRAGGAAIVLETMTTGSETAAPPTEGLATHYRWPEAERGFSRTPIRTDYQFESLEEADRLTRFFFGDERVDRVRRDNSVILPKHRHLVTAVRIGPSPRRAKEGSAARARVWSCTKRYRRSRPSCSVRGS
jgi:hypothetical protein